MLITLQEMKFDLSFRKDRRTAFMKKIIVDQFVKQKTFTISNFIFFWFIFSISVLERLSVVTWKLFAWKVIM